MVLSRNIHRLANLVLALIVVGIALWLINSYVPMAGSIKAILNFVVVIATCVMVLQAFGLWSPVVRMWNTLVVRYSGEVTEHDNGPVPPEAPPTKTGGAA